MLHRVPASRGACAEFDGSKFTVTEAGRCGLKKDIVTVAASSHAVLETSFFPRVPVFLNIFAQSIRGLDRSGSRQIGVAFPRRLKSTNPGHLAYP
jgi:hypothetical protein